MTNKPILKVKNLSVVFENKYTILDNISFSLAPEEVLGIIGPNGSGKTILLKTLLGIIEPSKGTIQWDKKTRIGYLPQRFPVDHYLPMIVEEFLELKPNHQYNFDEIAKMLNVEKDEWLKKDLAHLSGGEIQKVLLAWALIDKPNVLLFDEPTENVDVVGQESIYNLLHFLQDTLHLSIIIITHDLTNIYRYTNNVLCLSHKMVCYGEPFAILTEKTLRELYGSQLILHHHTPEKITSARN